MSGRKRVLALAVIMGAVAAGATGAAILVLYDAAFDGQQARLTQTARTWARLIETMVRHEQGFGHASATDLTHGDSLTAALAQLQEVQQGVRGAAAPGELAVARKEGDQIVFLVSRRADDSRVPEPVSASGPLAAPMRRALAGESGAGVMLDYRGTKVLAAHEPANELGLGVVAKVDLAEIRAPFVQAGLLAAGIGLTLVLLGAVLFIRVGSPLARGIEESERKYRTLFDSGWDGVFVLRGLRAEECNAQACRLFACSREDLIGHSATEFWPPTQADGRPSIKAGGEFARAAEAGQPQFFPWLHKRRDGTLIDTDVALKAVTIDGRPALITTVRDVTEQRRTQAALAESSERYQALFDAVTDAVFVHQVDETGAPGAILEVNDVACRRLGYTREELARVPVRDIDAPESDVDARAIVQRLCRGEDALFEQTHVARDGRRIPVEIHAQSFTFRGRTAILSVSRDISERRQAEEQLRQERAFLRRVIDTVPGFVFVKDERSRFVLANRAVAECYGTTPVNLIGKCDADFNADAEQVAAFIRDDRAVIAERRARHIAEEKVTGADGRERWLTTTKVPLMEADGTCRRLLATSMDITERKRAEQGLQEREAQLRSIFRAAPIGIGMVIDRVLKAVNERMCALVGYAPAELLEQSSRMLYPSDEDYEYVGRVKYAELRAHGVGNVETRWRRKDGVILHIQLSSAPLDPANLKAGVIFTALNITERKQAEDEKRRLEGQLRQAQKMEAVGQLAGGIAHDFNNILTSIGGNVELALQQLHGRPDDDPLRGELREVERSVERAAGLTRQLLAFSRRQVARQQVLDLSQIVAGMEPMLRRLLSENIRLDNPPVVNLPRIRADAVQIEQIIMNLVVNARDAMPEGGTLTVETAGVALDEEYAAKHADARPGAYVLLTVSDTGCGMDAATLEHIFEPFFTTKGQGQGTGLGLATVYGIAKQTGGHVLAYSELGHGSIFRVYLPAASDDAPVESPRPAGPPAALTAPTGTETVLVCEDDAIVREITVRFLQSAGYTVCAAASGAEALRLTAAHPEPIDLLVTDVIMADINGRKLAETLLAQRPGLGVLFVSGYTANVIAHHGVLDPGVEFLEKPFTRRDLLRRVREVLEAARRKRDNA